MRKQTRKQRTFAIISDHFRKTENPISITTLCEKTGLNKNTMHSVVRQLVDEELIKHYTGWGYYPLVKDDRLYKIVNKAFKPIKEELIA
jgi:predicted transcriptional regulator